MKKENPQNNNYRFERKFFISNLDRLAVENIILQNPAFFSEIHQERWVNNVYFDYLGFNNFLDNIVGNMYRKKYRIRWYGNLFSEINKPKLEIKFKEGLLGDKKTFQLVPFKLDIGINLSIFKDIIINSKINTEIKFNIHEQIPVMLNRYKRKYFESSNKKIRITIDNQQSFYKLNKFNNTFLDNYKDPDSVILEIKYDQKYDIEAAQISNNFPFRLSKSSKYARGVELLYC